MEKLNIKIASQSEAPSVVVAEPGKYFVVSIRDPEDTFMPIDKVIRKCRGIIIKQFHDVIEAGITSAAPNIRDIQDILEWSNGKDDILVHCAAGVSRSSAVAYLIACSRMPPVEAIGILDWNLHWPNKLIVEFGADILKSKAVSVVCDVWMHNKGIVA